MRFWFRRYGVVDLNGDKILGNVSFGGIGLKEDRVFVDFRVLFWCWCICWFFIGWRVWVVVVVVRGEVVWSD